VEVVLDGVLVVELEEEEVVVVLLLGADDVLVELALVVDEVEVLLLVVVGASVVVVEVGAPVVVVGASVVVVLVGDGGAAPPHGSGLQVPGPMSRPPFLRHARGVFTRHLETPLALVWQHWTGSRRRWRPAASAPRPGEPNEAATAVSQKRTAAMRDARAPVDMLLASSGRRTARRNG
jgi:hypothetical protein